MDSLYLTAEEKKLFDALPETLREGWKVVEEERGTYESDDELLLRRKMASFKDFPQVTMLVDRLQKGDKPETLSLEGIPESILSELCFTIGARGLSVLTGRLLLDAKTDADMEGLVGLSQFRHEMLLTNASVSLQ
ncbi:MAG: hypothetical protein WC840_03635 [Candidatus Peribacteraceae bacterium]